jgi:hypothetical protein
MVGRLVLLGTDQLRVEDTDIRIVNGVRRHVLVHAPRSRRNSYGLLRSVCDGSVRRTQGSPKPGRGENRLDEFLKSGRDFL